MTSAVREPVFKIDKKGTTRWTVDGVPHREDGPAVKFANGTMHWYCHGLRHRDDGPAVEFANGTMHWYCHGLRHRDDGPAAEYANGEKEWYLNHTKYSKPEWLREVLKDRPLTIRQRELLDALSENWEGTPDSLYETATHLAT